MRRHIEVASEALEEAAEQSSGLRKLVRFDIGAAEAIPTADASVDLICCREMLYHVEALEGGFAECARVLRGGGHMVIYQMFATDRLEPREADRMWAKGGMVKANADPRHIEAAFTAAGFRIAELIEPGSECGELAQEETGDGGRRLIHAARLLRDPERYVAKFGRAAYDTMLGDCLWHVYRMIGKLSLRVYLLKAPETSSGS